MIGWISAIVCDLHPGWDDVWAEPGNETSESSRAATATGRSIFNINLFSSRGFRASKYPDAVGEE
jgi:hypothetical protein